MGARSRSLQPGSGFIYSMLASLDGSRGFRPDDSLPCFPLYASGFTVIGKQKAEYLPPSPASRESTTKGVVSSLGPSAGLRGRLN